MSDFEKFRTEVLRDLSLQQKLIGPGSQEDFVRRVVETGAEYGFVFSVEDVEEAMRSGHAEWVLRWV